MVATAVRKVGQIARMWPGRARLAPTMPRAPQLDTRTDPLPPRSLTAVELIAMARAARRTGPDVRDPSH